ncbi:MAG: cysteine desulfurase family protein [Oligoflexales bacterium]
MKLVYADYNATYPCSESHFDMVSRVIKKTQGNPSSIHHFGREAKLILEEARQQVAAIFGAERQSILFTSGATEANNLAVQGFFKRFHRSSQRSPKPHMIISQGEHPSITQPAEWLRDQGLVDLCKIPLSNDGMIDHKALMAAIREQTVFISIIYANNETGIINPIEELTRKIKQQRPSIHVHADAVQAFGKLDISWIGASQLDSASASAHKVGGLKGVGSLFLRSGSALDALLLGGGQEQRLRSGTENMPGLVSFGLRAREILAKPDWLLTCKKVRDHFVEHLLQIPGACVHGDLRWTLSNTVNFHIKGLGGDILMLQFDINGIAVSSGSACSSGVGAPSSVLLGMGFSEWVSLNSVRVSFGAGSTVGDSEHILAVIKQAAGGS